MLKPWWDRWPGRLEYELRELDSAGIPYELDEEAFRQGIVRLRLRAKPAGEVLNLVAVFPDLYPYFRFEIIAHELDLPRHQHPFEKNLCLIGRATVNWGTNDTLAQFIRERLPPMLRTARSNNPEEIAGLEEHQGEPFSDYYPCIADAMVLIDSSWSLGPHIRKGELIIGVGDESGWLLRGAILEVHGENGASIAKADAAIAKLYSKTVRGRWVRVDRPINEGDPGRFINVITGQTPDLRRPVWQRFEGSRIDVIGVVFPEEVQWRKATDGWIFAVRFKGEGKQGAYFARAGRAGVADLASRSPALASLQESSVAVVGLGCLGAPSALEFARNGLGVLRLLDHDIIDPGTTPRWPFGFSAAGLTKTDVLKRFIAGHYPYTRAMSWRHRIGGIRGTGPSDLEVLDDLLQGVDLVFDATAEIGIEHLLADLANERKIPYICISATQGGWGGLIARIRPDETRGCWVCLRHALTDGTIPNPPADPGGELQPLGCADPTFTGTSFDLGNVTLAGVRLAICTLSRQTEGGYPDVDWDVAVLSLRDTDGHAIAPRWETFPLLEQPSCPCGKG